MAQFNPGDVVSPSEVVTPTDVKCPFCGGALRHPDGWTGFDSDSTGPFVMCRHCQRRVTMEQIHTPQGSPKEFRIAPNQ